MAIEDIKKAILDETQKIVKEHKISGQEKVAEIKKNWEKIINDKKKERIAITAQKIEQKIKQAEFQIQTESQFKILKEKHEIINQIYDLALKKLNNLSEAQYVLLMEKLIKELPGDEGDLFSVGKKNNLLQKALKNSAKKYKLSSETLEGHGGFIFRSVKIEVNQSFEAIIENNKEKTLLTISDKVFK